MEKGNKASMKKFWGSGFLTLGHVKDVVLLCLLVVVTWKLINSNISITLESFSFTDLLSVLLAFFAIALSAAFYFKATDTSNQFYDNSYKFTKEMSEILGRIEAGFGEKLKHIDDGYIGLRDKFDKMPFNFQEAEKKKEEEEEHIREQETERDRIISSLLEKAKLDEKEKEDLLQKLAENANEVKRSQEELDKIKKNIHEEDEKSRDLYLVSKMSSAIRKQVSDPRRDKSILGARQFFERLLNSGAFDEELLNEMDEGGLIKEESLTKKGIMLLNAAILSRL